MEKTDLLRQMIAEKKVQIQLYQAMVAEWERELGAPVAPSTPPSPSANAKDSSPSGEPIGAVKEYEFHNKSQVEAARIYLERVGYPQSTQQIIDALMRGGLIVGGKTPQAKKTNLYTILFRSRENFGRAGKDVWGLRGWKGIPKVEEESKEGNGKDESEKASD